MSERRCLVLFGGEGGDTAGWVRAGWDVLCVDNDPARLAVNPFPSVLADALEYGAAHAHEFDAVTADAKPELRDPIMLCGRQFGLTATDSDGTPLVLDRHRMFEGGNGLRLVAPAHPKHDRSVQVAGVYGGARRDKHEARHVRKGGYVPPDISVLRELIGADWMTERGLFHALPPAYGEYIARQVTAHLDAS